MGDRPGEAFVVGCLTHRLFPNAPSPHPPDGLDSDLLRRLAETLGAHPGRCDVYLHCLTAEQMEVTVHATSACRVAPSAEVRAEVEELLGEGSLWFSAGNGLPSHTDATE